MRNADSHIGLGHATQWWWWWWWCWWHTVFAIPQTFQLCFISNLAKAHSQRCQRRRQRHSFYAFLFHLRSASKFVANFYGSDKPGEVGGRGAQRTVHTPGRQRAILLLFKEHIKHMCGIIWKKSWKMGAKLWKMGEQCEEQRQMEESYFVLRCEASKLHLL